MNLQEHGFEFIKSLLTHHEVESLAETLGTLNSAGTRSLLIHPEIQSFASSSKILAVIQTHLNSPARAVRAIFFDKTAPTNWLVPWHQDLSIVVQERHEVEGFGPWSVKEELIHVQPPNSILENMLTIRIHLDPCDESNGALKVLAGSHLNGKLESDQIQKIRSETPEHLCELQLGDALLMKPLLLHASSRSQDPNRRRRVLHIEYAGCSLPKPLRW